MAYTEAAILFVPSQYTYLPPLQEVYISSTTEKPKVVDFFFKVDRVTKPPITVTIPDKISFQSPSISIPQHQGCADCNGKPIPYKTDFVF